MSDLQSLSNDEIISLMGQQNQAAMAHTAPSEPTHGGVNPYDPTKDMNVGQRLLAGAGRGMTNVARHAGNLIGLVPDSSIAEANKLDAPLMNTTSGTIGSMIGETAPLIPASMGLSAGLGALGKGGAFLASNPIANGAIQGAAQGGLMADPGHRTAGATIGAVTGASIPTMAALFSKALRGVNRTPEAQQLLDEGVRLTPGQMNPEGVMNKLEENVRGWPVVGNMIEKARGQAQSDFQRGVIEDAAAPGTTLNPGTDVNALFQQAQDSYKPLYKQAEGFNLKPEITNVNNIAPASNNMQELEAEARQNKYFENESPSDAQRIAENDWSKRYAIAKNGLQSVMVNSPSKEPLINALIRAANDKTVGAGAAVRQDAQDFLDGQFQAAAEKANAIGGWKSEHLIQLRSSINEEIRNAGFDQAGRKYAQLLKNGRDQVTASLNDQLPPQASQILQTANDAYPKLAIIRDAIKRGGDQPQGFTPAQLSQAVKSATENNEFARGGGLLRDWSSAGRDIFTQRNPHTGSALATGAVLGAAAHASPMVALPTGAAALGLIGTDAGRNFMSGQTGWQQAAQKIAAALNSKLNPVQNLIGTSARTAIGRGVANSDQIRAALTSALGTGNP